MSDMTFNFPCHLCHLAKFIFTARQRSCGKVMFSFCHSVRGGIRLYLVQGSFPMPGPMLYCGVGIGYLEGEGIGDRLSGVGYQVWGGFLEGRVYTPQCPTPGTTKADGTHPIGMLSCCDLRAENYKA